MPSAPWRPIVGYEGDYEVSSDGRVRSRKTGHSREMKPKHNRFTGYDYVILSKGGKSKTFSIHRLVAVAFIPNPSSLPQVNHKNEIKTDNRVTNLEWCTPAYNSNYSKEKKYKGVSIYDPEGRLVATFSSCSIAADFLGVTKGAIANALSGVNGTCRGFELRPAKAGE